MCVYCQRWCISNDKNILINTYMYIRRRCANPINLKTRSILTNHPALCLNIPQKYRSSCYPALAPQIPTFWLRAPPDLRNLAPLLQYAQYAPPQDITHAHCDVPRTFVTFVLTTPDNGVHGFIVGFVDKPQRHLQYAY